MNSNIKLRKVDAGDAFEWVTLKNRLWRFFYKHIFPEEVFLEKEKIAEKKIKDFSNHIYNSNDMIAYVAEVKGEIIGIMSGRISSSSEHFNGEYAELSQLYVEPSYQGMGIGTGFKKIFEDWARENGARKYVIGVLKDNVRSRIIYEAWGGKISDYITNLYQLDVPYKKVFYTYDLYE